MLTPLVTVGQPLSAVPLSSTSGTTRPFKHKFKQLRCLPVHLCRQVHWACRSKDTIRTQLPQAQAGMAGPPCPVNINTLNPQLATAALLSRQGSASGPSRGVVTRPVLQTPDVTVQGCCRLGGGRLGQCCRSCRHTGFLTLASCTAAQSSTAAAAAAAGARLAGSSVQGVVCQKQHPAHCEHGPFCDVYGGRHSKRIRRSAQSLSQAVLHHPTLQGCHPYTSHPSEPHTPIPAQLIDDDAHEQTLPPCRPVH